MLTCRLGGTSPTQHRIPSCISHPLYNDILWYDWEPSAPLTLFLKLSCLMDGALLHSFSPLDSIPTSPGDHLGSSETFELLGPFTCCTLSHCRSHWHSFPGECGEGLLAAGHRPVFCMRAQECLAHVDVLTCLPWGVSSTPRGAVLMPLRYSQLDDLYVGLYIRLPEILFFWLLLSSEIVTWFLS